VSIWYYPPLGEILLCDYGTQVVPPEMDKRRPVVIVTPRLRRRGELVGVVPLSTTAPDVPDNHHYEFEIDKRLPEPFDSPTMWAKCDMFSVVSRGRLDRFKAGRAHGQRIYLSGKVNADQMRAIRAAMLCGLGLDSLTIHL
jgi:mRNA interferase MazF